MKKLLLLVMILILPLVFAINLRITEQSAEDVMILGVDQPVRFNLQVTNLDESDDFEFFNLLGFSMAPKGTVRIKSGETASINLLIYPRNDFQYRGFYLFTYHIRGTKSSGSVTDQVAVKILDLSDAFEIGVKEFEPELNQLVFYIKNKENFDFPKISADFSSVFFQTSKEFSLEPKEEKEFKTNFNYEDYKELTAGFYTLTAEISVGKNKTRVEGVINFRENQNIKTSRESSGFLISTQTIKKQNLGNVEYPTQISVKKNIISRLFTSFSPKPDSVEMKVIFIEYFWEDMIKPGENLEIKITTNWIFPILIIVLIYFIIVFLRKYKREDVVIKKKINFVHSKSGEFALKISLLVNARRYVEKVNLSDRIPAMVKIYSKFGGQEPSKFSEETRKIEWNFEKLEEGEMRTCSYVIYSKVGVMGKFALPTATAIYERDGKLKRANSNQVFFVAESREKEEK